MNRRSFLQKASIGKSTSKKDRNKPINLIAQNLSLAPYSGWSSDPTAAAHLLRRTMFGAPPATVNYFKTLNLNQAVEELLTVSADPPPVPPSDYYTQEFHDQLEADLANGIIPTWLQVDPAPPINDYSVSNQIHDGAVPKGMPWVGSAVNQLTFPDSWNGTSLTQTGHLQYLSFSSWWGKLMLNQENNIREKMTLFWHNHFGMRLVNDGQNHNKKTRYWNNALLRHHALGSFKDLIKAITLDPQMNVLLDIGTNIAGSINENYARELQELFTLGLLAETSDTGNSYTETDVNQLARILTGWFYKTNFDCSTGCVHTNYREVYFQPYFHDTTDKQFSSFYGNALIPGDAGENGGEAELDAFLDVLFTTRGLEIGKFLARELYRFFVRPSFAYSPEEPNNTALDTQIEQEIIIPLANAFVAQECSTYAIIDLLLKSEHFYSECNRGSMIKSPVDFSVGMCRDFSIYPATIIAAGSITEDVNVFRNAHSSMAMTVPATLSQSPNNPVNVYGWDAYVNAPYDNNWVNGATFARRAVITKHVLNPFGTNIGYNIAGGANIYMEPEISQWYIEEVDLVAFAMEHFSNPSDMSVLIDEAVAHFLAVPIHDSVKSQLENILENSQPGYWGYTWDQYQQDMTDESNLSAITFRLREFFRALFNLEEYHLM